MSGAAAKIIAYPVPQAAMQDCLSSTIERHLRAYFAAHESASPVHGLYDRVLNEIERPLISVVLQECGGNQLRAAELLGLNRNTLRKKMRALGLLSDRRKRERKIRDV